MYELDELRMIAILFLLLGQSCLVPLDLRPSPMPFVENPRFCIEIGPACKNALQMVAK